MKFGTAIREARIRKGMTQKALAEAVEVSPQHIHDLEHGRRGASRDLIRLLAATLSLDANDLFIASGLLPDMMRCPKCGHVIGFFEPWLLDH